MGNNSTKYKNQLNIDLSIPNQSFTIYYKKEKYGDIIVDENAQIIVNYRNTKKSFHFRNCEYYENSRSIVLNLHSDKYFGTIRIIPTNLSNIIYEIMIIIDKKSSLLQNSKSIHNYLIKN